jgi:hypothetical protein
MGGLFLLPGGRMKTIKAGQSTMEYVIVFAVVVGAIVIVTWSLKPKVQSAYNEVVGVMRHKLSQ